jgi:desulfoferrodoxin (superoxide reductase-like protein)
MKDQFRKGGVKAVIGMLGLIAVFSFSALTPMTAYANPPKEIKLVYNTTSQKLEVTITHETSFPGYHYVKQIEIKKKGDSVSAHNYQSQPSKAEFTYKYDVSAAEGDVLEVTAQCNLSGSKTVKLTVGKQEK